MAAIIGLTFSKTVTDQYTKFIQICAVAVNFNATHMYSMLIVTDQCTTE